MTPSELLAVMVVCESARGGTRAQIEEAISRLPDWMPRPMLGGSVAAWLLMVQEVDAARESSAEEDCT